MGVDVNDPKDNLRGAAKYLSQQMQKFNDPVLALMAYNWGPSSVERWLASGQDVNRIPKQTLDYVERILGVDLMEGAE
jgi:soluble lytic murein transglycosylase-like protein